MDKFKAITNTLSNEGILCLLVISKTLKYRNAKLPVSINTAKVFHCAQIAQRAIRHILINTKGLHILILSKNNIIHVKKTIACSYRKMKISYRITRHYRYLNQFEKKNTTSGKFRWTEGKGESSI